MNCSIRQTKKIVFNALKKIFKKPSKGKTCSLIYAFYAYKNIWVKIVYLHFVLFRLFVRVKSFLKKKTNCLNTLNYNTTEFIPLSQCFSIISVFFNCHSVFQPSQYFSIVTMFFNHYSTFQLSQFFSVVTIFFNHHNIFQSSQSLWK